MRRMPWAVYLWPGLPQLLQRGSWLALAWAVVASVVLNVVLVGSFVWPEWIAPRIRIIGWVALATAWSVSAGCSVWWERRGGRPYGPVPGDPFTEALDYYLKGNWFETERLLDRVLRRNSRDLEARLLLATLFRHTQRLEEATRQLNLLVRLEGSQKWELEIRREGELITEARKRTITSANTAQANNGED